jgi:hypothetical protein
MARERRGKQRASSPEIESSPSDPKQLKKLRLWLIVLARERRQPRLLCAPVVMEDLIHRVLQLMLLIHA